MAREEEEEDDEEERQRSLQDVTADGRSRLLERY